MNVCGGVSKLVRLAMVPEYSLRRLAWPERAVPLPSMFPSGSRMKTREMRGFAVSVQRDRACPLTICRVSVHASRDPPMVA